MAAGRQKHFGIGRAHNPVIGNDSARSFVLLAMHKLPRPLLATIRRCRG
jgi:hypothetical protein